MTHQHARVLNLDRARADKRSEQRGLKVRGPVWAKAVKGYTTSLQAAGRRPGTVRLHLHYLGLLERHCPNFIDVDRTALESWLANPDWSPETRKSARSVAVVFFRWAQSYGLVERSPAVDLLPVTVPPAAARPAPDWAYRQALAEATPEVQWMLKLARLAGLRCAEIAAVSSRDLDGDLLYVTGKGGRRRIVPIVDAELRRAIAQSGQWLFPSPHGGHYTPGWVSKVIGRALPGQWTAHQLRHAFATHSYARHPDVLALGRVLGHSAPETTMRYVATPVEALRGVVTAAA